MAVCVSVLNQAIGWEEQLHNHLSCVGWNVKNLDSVNRDDCVGVCAGSLCVDSLGRLTRLSDTPRTLLPVNFRYFTPTSTSVDVVRIYSQQIALVTIGISGIGNVIS